MSQENDWFVTPVGRVVNGTGFATPQKVSFDGKPKIDSEGVQVEEY